MFKVQGVRGSGMPSLEWTSPLPPSPQGSGIHVELGEEIEDAVKSPRPAHAQIRQTPAWGKGADGA